jgi:hypothetical protein
MSASPPTPDVSLQGNEPTLRAISGHRGRQKIRTVPVYASVDDYTAGKVN